ncbi:MAG: right-handed parallel beta-helix repeat-containing protein [bacterium]|nr:right-handed parallel beta-helix repeat-containing protein [bacterium]
MHQLYQTFKRLPLIGAACLLLVATSAVVAQSSLDLTGANDYAFASDAVTFDFLGGFTIDLQFRSTNAVEGCLLAKFHQSSGSTLDDSYFVVVQADGSLEARIQTTTALGTMNGGSGAHDGNWHHVALVYDPTDGYACLFLDGTSIDSVALTSPVRNSAEPIRLGALRTTGALTTFFDGYIDELRFWNSARRAEQASCLRDVTILENTPGLVSYYRFDEAAGTDAFDVVAPFENIQLISGALFSSFEPVFQSRLTGPGMCLCGNLSGSYASPSPAILLVGDTVRVAVDDTLLLSGVAITVDSSVECVSFDGYLATGPDSISFTTQPGGFGGPLKMSGDPTSSLSRTRFTGFTGYAVHVSSGGLISNSMFAGPGGGIFADFAEVVIDSCDFTDCTADSGSVIVVNAGAVQIENCRFHDCAGASLISIADAAPIAPADAVLSRSLLYGNSVSGALIAVTGSEATVLRNLTITANSAATLISAASPTLLSSSILTGNSTHDLAGAAVDVYYSILANPDFLFQHENFAADPVFIDPAQSNFALAAGSPAINHGDPDTQFDDPDGTRNDIGALAAGDFAPVLQSVLDVPHDNGRQVMVQWLPSAGDDNRGGIAGYSVWRKVNLASLENFELIAELPAGQLPGYGQVAPTLADSNQAGLPYYSYFVRAQSQNPLAYWDTALDSAYSVDNLSPGAPLLLAELESDGVRLSWEAVPDSDLAYYAIYRADSVFDPDTMVTALTTTADTTLVDGPLVSDDYAYVVRAVDINGNYSNASNLEFVHLTVLRAPLALTILHQSGVVTLTWYGWPEAGQYALHRSSDFGDSWTQFATTPDTFFVTTPTATSFLYRVVSQP